MAPKVKTTEAEYRSMRINPKTSKEDADTLKLIQDLEDKGWTFKQIAQDAILRSAGHEPEMYARNGSGYILGNFEDMLTRFAHEIIDSIRGQGGELPQGGTKIEISSFANKFAKSIKQRSESKGDE